VNDGVIELVKNVGFPIAVATFLLWKVDHRLSKLETKLTELIVVLKGYIKINSPGVDK